MTEKIEKTFSKRIPGLLENFKFADMDGGKFYNDRMNEIFYEISPILAALDDYIYPYPSVLLEPLTIDTIKYNKFFLSIRSKSDKRYKHWELNNKLYVIKGNNLKEMLTSYDNHILGYFVHFDETIDAALYINVFNYLYYIEADINYDDYKNININNPDLIAHVIDMLEGRIKYIFSFLLFIYMVTSEDIKIISNYLINKNN